MHCRLAETCSVSAGRNPDGHMLTGAGSQVNTKPTPPAPSEVEECPLRGEVQAAEEGVEAWV